MKIAKTLVLGAAGAVMISGSALAADPPPVNMPAMPPAPVEIGPEVTVDFIALLSNLGPFALGVTSFGYVNVEWPSGWGVEVEAGGFVGIIPLFGIAGGFDARVYRSFGDFEVGLGGSFPSLDLYASLFYEYESDRLTIDSENYLTFFPGFDFYSWTEIAFQATDALLIEAYVEFEPAFDEAGLMGTYTVNDRLDVWAALELDSSWYAGFGVEFDVTPALMLWAEAWIEIGTGMDYAGIGLEFEVNDMLTLLASIDFWFPGWAADLGFLYERPIGAGPWSLIGVGDLFYESGFGFGFGVGIGVRYSLGEVDDLRDAIFGPL